MSLKRLLRLLAALLTLFTLLLVGRLAATEWQTYQRAVAGRVAVDQLRHALAAAEMVSRERGPTNGLLGDGLPTQPPRRSALDEARVRTDAAFNTLQQVLAGGEDRPRWRDAGQRFAAARTALAQARAVVERTAALPLAERRPELLHQAVHGMVDVVPLLAPAISLLADEAQHAFPALGSDVQGARLVAELREYAGLLGSHFTAALSRQQAFTPAERAAIERTRGRIAELRFLVELQIQSATESPAVQAQWQLVDVHYFNQASALVEQVITAGSAEGRYGMDPAGFAARYVPDMNTMFGLRDALLVRAGARAAAERDHATDTLLLAAAGTLLLLIWLVGSLVLVNRRVLRPLSQTAMALHALARNELDAPLPQPVADDEMAAVISAVRSLQAHARERCDAERERDGLIERLRDQSNTDFLTGLPNRRAFFAACAREMAQARRHGFGMVMILLDVDHFKQFNDRLGHAAGDRALTEVARVVQRALRRGDLVARHGGEEFVVLLSHCDLARGMAFAERLREAIASAAVLCPSGEVAHVTASLGVADTGRHGLDADTLLAQADAAMYRAKQAGRNRVAADEPTAPLPAPVPTSTPTAAHTPAPAAGA